ncbi:MAG: class I SAM-dependent methyltransferase [Bryobacterales bacterium]|nr:class I SAM-dependent methyltransferase [Bryobacterales bacterium]
MNTVHRLLCRSGMWRSVLEDKMMPWVLDGQDMGDDVLEIGPGPGLTTEILRRRVRRLTALEIDWKLAVSLAARPGGGNVRVVQGDATAMPFPDACFSAAISLTMLHHVPSRELQDKLFAEALRVLRPGGRFVACDSRKSFAMTLLHAGDTMVLVDPETVGGRLERAGFHDVQVQCVERAFKVTAVRR